MDAIVKFALLLLFALAATGCQTTSGGTFCAISKPIRLTGQSVDALTDQEVAAILAHNERGQRLCGWNP